MLRFTKKMFIRLLSLHGFPVSDSAKCVSLNSNV